MLTLFPSTSTTPMESKNMTPLTSIALRKTADFTAAAAPAAIALGIALAIAPTWARAETQVRGTPQAVVVEAQNATVEEILGALTDTFKVHFRSAASLDKRLTGTYEGTLQQAVSHILKGYDFVVKSGPAGLEITLLGSGKPVAVVGARPATKSAEAAPVAASQPTPAATADNGDHPVPMPSSGGPTPPIRVAQGPAPVPTPPAPGTTAPNPVPQVGSGPAPSPTPPQPGAAPTPVPPLPIASSAVPQPPTATPSTIAPPAPASAPSPSPAVVAPPAPAPAR
jgi:hypothetical protein